MAQYIQRELVKCLARNGVGVIDAKDGATPDSVVPPDREHIRTILAARKPHVVVACGRQAELALLDIWSGPLLAIPHPAHRLVTNALYQQAKLILMRLNTRVALRQRNGQVITEHITSSRRE